MPDESQFGEPWQVDGNDVMNSEGIFVMYESNKLNEANTSDILCRIVACVNFCAGAPTEWLDKQEGGIKRINDATVSLEDAVDRLGKRLQGDGV